jgi:pimeloyl-ACP methyl ester carboxylesterase
MQERQELISVRRHGPRGRSVVVLHGGPGAPGGAELLARALADPLHVLEPWQRLSSDVPLTVARHMEDLAAAISHEIPGEKPALVGESWGAMLGLAFTSAYPDRVSALALVGCGTFDRKARARLQSTLAERTTPELREQLARLATRVQDENERAARMHALADPLHHPGSQMSRLEARSEGHTESWRTWFCSRNQRHPPHSRPDTCPVLMPTALHDPHPGG